MHALKLVYPPISNQEGEWLSKDPEVRKILSSSKLYVLAQREELLFADYRIDPESGEFEFHLVCGATRTGPISMPLSQLGLDPELRCKAEIGPKCLKIRKLSEKSEEEPLYWCTPDILINQWQKGIVALEGIDSAWEFLRFRMHYVGISKKHDSIHRLFETHHKARTGILTNERQITPDSRVSDELMLFMFYVEPSLIEANLTEKDVESMWLNEADQPSENEYIADAEKALINILDSSYNDEKFKSYPKSGDGLWGKGFDCYGFYFGELIEFSTSSCKIRGGDPFGASQPDLILVKGDQVELLAVSESEKEPSSGSSSNPPEGSLAD